MDIVIKQEPVHQDIDQSDVSSEPNIDDAFSWAYSPESYATQAGDSVWKSSEDIQWHEGRKCARLEPFDGLTGVNLHYVESDTPLDFFHMFVPRSLFSVARKETNNYVEFYQDQKRDQGREWWDWTDSGWNPIEDEDEMCKFLGICMVMSVRKLPHPRYYWSSHEELREDLVADALPGNRFSKLMQYLYLSNPWRDPERIGNLERRAEACLRDPLYKLSSSLLPSVMEASRAMYTPNQNLIVRQRDVFDSSKSLGQVQSSDLMWKVLTVEDASTGFIKNSLFHRVDACNTTFPSDSDIRELLCDLENKSHVVYADSVFISPQTACNLVERRIHVCANASAWPSEFDDTNMAPLSSDARLYRHYKDVTAAAWKCGDNVRRHLTTFEDEAHRRSSIDSGTHGDINNLTFSHVVGENASKKHLDEDGYLLSNSKLLSQMSKTNWKRSFWTVIDIALNNASILWNESGRVPFTLSEFTMEVARELMSGESEVKCDVASSRQIAALPPQPVMMQQASPLSLLSAENANALLEEAKSGQMFNPPTMVPVSNVEHALVKFPGRGRNCRQCMAEQLRTRCGRRRDTQFGCDVCGINLCRATCFVKYHTQYNLKINRLSMTQIAKLDFQPPAKRTRPSLGPFDLPVSVSTVSTPPSLTDAASDDTHSV